MAKSWRYANCGGIPAAAAQSVVVGSSAAACNPFFPEIPQIQEIAQNLQRFEFHSRLNIEVVDDTAVIGARLLSKAKNQKKKKTKTMKGRARKDWIVKKTAVADKGKAAYSRAEMLALGRRNVKAQRKKWSEVYGSLAASVAAEYDGLAAPPMRGGGAVPTFAFRRRPSVMEKPHNFDGAAAAMGRGSPQKIPVH